MRAGLAGFLWLASAAEPAAAERPEIHYMLHCQGCHRTDGAGTEGSVPALRESMGRFLGVPGGRAYLVQVPGSAQSPLGDAELAALLNWMIDRFGPAEAARDFEPFSAAEVARYRKTPLTEVDEVRRKLVRRIGAGVAR